MSWPILLNQRSSGFHEADPLECTQAVTSVMGRKPALMSTELSKMICFLDSILYKLYSKFILQVQGSTNYLQTEKQVYSGQSIQGATCEVKPHPGTSLAFLYLLFIYIEAQLQHTSQSKVLTDASLYQALCITIMCINTHKYFVSNFR